VTIAAGKGTLKRPNMMVLPVRGSIRVQRHRVRFGRERATRGI